MSKAANQQALQNAVRLHQAGRLDQAESMYQQILKTDPKHPDALNLLGTLNRQRGRNDLAVEYIQQAISAKRSIAEYHFNLGEAFRALGKNAEAVAAYQKSLDLRPSDAEAHYGIAVVLEALGRGHDAIDHYRQAVRLKPDMPECHSNLAILLDRIGKFDEAIAHAQRAVQLRPNYPQAWHNMGTALAGRGRYEEAINALIRAVQIDPNVPETFYNLGNSFEKLDRLDDAVRAYRRAIELRPNYVEAFNNLAAYLQKRGMVDEAISWYRGALEVLTRDGRANQPEYAEVYSNLGVAHWQKGEAAEAQTCYARALEVNPQHAQAHLNQALVHLLDGDFETGWRLYEWRWQTSDFDPIRRTFPKPRWDGSDLNGKTIFVHSEQGFGDTIQFVRYAKLLKDRGARVVLEVQPPLKSLLNRVDGIDSIIGRGDALPAFDVEIGLLSLPLMFRTDLNSIPWPGAYLSPDPTKVEAWRAKLPPAQGNKRVGLVWAGSTLHKNDRNRSIALSMYAPLAQVTGFQFVSLQKGEGSSQAAQPPAGMDFFDLTSSIVDFDDTAALIAHLDLVISVDTSVVHLAGAMGKPVWVLMPFVPDFRWLRDRADSPWYPSMRLFRQKVRGEWGPVLEELTRELGKV